MSRSQTVDLVVAYTSTKTVQPTKPLHIRNIGSRESLRPLNSMAGPGSLREAN
jgi:hypothetical protein